MLLQKIQTAPTLVKGSWVLLFFFFLPFFIYGIVAEEPMSRLLAFVCLFLAGVCLWAAKDDKLIRAELDELRKLINPPETEEV
ncbi:hypothetical protein ACFL3H_07900 [Gemmatimonadota bacterium]